MNRPQVAPQQQNPHLPGTFTQPSNAFEDFVNDIMFAATLLAQNPVGERQATLIIEHHILANIGDAIALTNNDDGLGATLMELTGLIMPALESGRIRGAEALLRTLHTFLMEAGQIQDDDSSVIPLHASEK